jgi:UDP-N-acetylglucosamine--N-acetylmuramyl-(pentapeptide) pyrophosphoryl-undecaprenol N-acetylglucosamine transferase
VIAAGGTAGHVVPALAVAEALRAEGAEVAFIGGDRAERTLVPEAGFPLHAISVEGLSRSSPAAAARALARAAAALPRVRALLGRLEPDAVMGGGGYVAGPVGVAAVGSRIPLVLTEADSHLGLTNRLLAPFARRVCLAFPLASAKRPGAGSAPGGGPRGGGLRGRRPASGARGPRYVVTGRPIHLSARDRRVARERFSIAPAETCVLVFGGSLGARSINLAAVEAFADGAFHVLHVSGSRDHRELGERELRAGYDLREYLDREDFATALECADLVVARAGGSVLEIAAHGLPAILVPYPRASGDHQSANARWMSEAGAAIVIPDDELTAARLADELAGLLADPARLAAMASAARGVARPDAAEQVARELLAAAGR